VNPRFCPLCAAPLALRSAVEDGGPRERLRCTACEYTHWNNPVPVLAAVLECVDRGAQLLLARNAAWPGRFFGLVTGFMEAGETPEQGLLREVAEETALQPAGPATLLGVWDFQKKNELIVAYHLPVQGEIRLSPELAEFKLLPPETVRCWPQGTGQALACFLRSRGIEPQWM
jgi:NADH pyrophosphatase NudC (nudix superfamily)